MAIHPDARHYAAISKRSWGRLSFDFALGPDREPIQIAFSILRLNPKSKTCGEQRRTIENLNSSDDPIRPRQQIAWNRQAYLLCCFQIDNELELIRLLDRQICWRSAFQNLVDIRGRTAEQVGKAHAVAHEPAFLDKFCTGVCRREPVFYRKFDNLRSVRVEDEPP